MAITKILPVRGQLKGCLDYAANPQKTEFSALLPSDFKLCAVLGGKVWLHSKQPSQEHYDTV